MFIRDRTETQKLEITSSEFLPISRDLGELKIPNMAQMFLMKSYRMLSNGRVIAFTFELLRENQQDVG